MNKFKIEPRAPARRLRGVCEKLQSELRGTAVYAVELFESDWRDAKIQAVQIFLVIVNTRISCMRCWRAIYFYYFNRKLKN